MIHTNFDESNFVFRAPKDMPECSDLHAYKDLDETDNPFVISAWDVSKEEIINLLLFKRVWLHVWGNQQPPVYLSAMSPFINSSNRIELSETERLENFKKRLASQFLNEQNLSEITEFADFQKLLGEFLDFIIERGE